MIDEYLGTMSGKAQPGNDLISHDSVTVRARLAMALRRRVPSCGLSGTSLATAPSSPDGHLVKQRESVPVTEETGLRCRNRCLREVERVSIRRRTRPLERAATVMARSSQKHSVRRVFLRRMRSLTEDGHAGIDVRATSKNTEIIICATQTLDVLEEKGRRTRRTCEAASIVQRRFGVPWCSVENFTRSSENRAHCAAQAESAR